MGAARMLGAAGGRLRSAAAVVGQRMTPFAPHAGRRCPLAPAAPTLPRRAPEYDDVRSAKVPPFSAGGAYSYGDKTGKVGASGIAGRWSRAEEEGADGNDVAADGRTKEPVKIAPFSTGGAHSGGKKPGKTGVGGRRRTEVVDGKDVAAGGQASEAVKLMPFFTGGAHSDREKLGKPGASGVAERTIDEADAFSDGNKTGNGIAGRWSRAEEKGADGNDVAADGRTNEAIKIAPLSTGGAHFVGKKPGKASVGGRRRTEVADGKDVAVGGHASDSEAVKLMPFCTGGAHSDREMLGKPGASSVAGRTIDEADGKFDAGFGNSEEVPNDMKDDTVPATSSEDAVPATSSCRYEDDLKQFMRWEIAKYSEARTKFLVDLFEKNRRDHHEKSRKESNRQLIFTFLMALAIEIGISLLNKEKKKTAGGEKGVEEHEKEAGGGGGEEARKGGGEEAFKGGKSGGEQASKAGKGGGEVVLKGGKGSDGKDAPKVGGGAKASKGGATTGVVVVGRAGEGRGGSSATAAAVESKGV